jgi:hypothetical protein
MEDAIRQAIADLSALIKDADSKDAERIREIIERLQNFDADTRDSLERTARLHRKETRINNRVNHWTRPEVRWCSSIPGEKHRAQC